MAYFNRDIFTVAQGSIAHLKVYIGICTGLLVGRCPCEQTGARHKACACWQVRGAEGQCVTGIRVTGRHREGQQHILINTLGTYGIEHRRVVDRCRGKGGRVTI